MSGSQGPGVISVDEVGCYTIATTSLLSARRIMAYAAAISDTNEAYFDDLRSDGLSVHPAICFSLQWNARFLLDRKITCARRLSACMQKRISEFSNRSGWVKPSPRKVG